MIHPFVPLPDFTLRLSHTTVKMGQMQCSRSVCREAIHEHFVVVVAESQWSREVEWSVSHHTTGTQKHSSKPSADNNCASKQNPVRLCVCLSVHGFTKIAFQVVCTHGARRR